MSGSFAAVVLAAGKGTRMKSDLPKVLHPIAGKPMVRHVTDLLVAGGADPLILVLAPGMDQVAKGVPGALVAIQDPPLGTGHAIMAAMPLLKDFTGDVLVAFADTPNVAPATYNALISARRTGAAIAVLGFRPKDPAQYGRLITDVSGNLSRIVEVFDATEAERAINLCNAGMMAIDGRLLAELLAGLKNDNAKGEYYQTDLVAVARAKGLDVVVVEAPENQVFGVNSRAELAGAEKIIQDRLRLDAMNNGVTLIDPDTVYLSVDTVLGRDVTIGPNVVIGPGVTIGDHVRIQAFCHLEGAQVAKGAIVGPFARLRPGADLNENVHVGNFVEVKNAILGPGVKANHLSYLGDATIGEGSNIGAGTITCNYDGFNKHRTEIGARSFIGSNSSLVAPIKIGDDAYIGSGSVVTKPVCNGELAVERAEQRNIPGWVARFRARFKKG